MGWNLGQAVKSQSVVVFLFFLWRGFVGSWEKTEGLCVWFLGVRSLPQMLRCRGLASGSGSLSGELSGIA